MPTLLLVRHGRTAANAAGILAGRSPGVELDETGRQQATAVAERLSSIRLDALVTSPLERCQQTAELIAERQDGLTPGTDERLTECDYGEWTGKTLAELGEEELWRVVQEQPSAAVFPGGESLRALHARAVDAVRHHDGRVASMAGKEAVWAAVSHGDVIKAIVADAMGLHLDLFQRLAVGPGSVTVIQYSERRSFVLRLNDSGGGFSDLRPAADDADVGGGT